MKITRFKQHSMETCGIACLLMVLDCFGLEYPTVGKEAAYYRQYGARCTPGTLGGGVALALVRRGLDVTLAHASPDMMGNRDGYYPPELHAAILAEHRDFIRRAGDALHLRLGEPITPEYLRSELAQGRPVIVEILVDGDADGMHERVLHGVVLYDTDGDAFLARDPLSPGSLRFTAEELMAAMDTPVGAMAISAGRRNA